MNALDQVRSGARHRLKCNTLHIIGNRNGLRRCYRYAETRFSSYLNPFDLSSAEVCNSFSPSAVRPTLIKAGFVEETDMNDDFVAIIFLKDIDFQRLDEVVAAVRWCQNLFRNRA